MTKLTFDDIEKAYQEGREQGWKDKEAEKQKEAK